MQFLQLTLGDDTEIFHQLVACYQSVFATGPWHEKWRCADPSCNEKWGIDAAHLLEKRNFECHDRPVVEFWPAEVVHADLKHDLAREGVVFKIVTLGAKILGFCYGYPVAVNELDALVGLEGAGEAFCSTYGEIDTVMYLDDIGVIKEHRGMLLGSRLESIWLKEAQKLGLSHCVLRTMTRPDPRVFNRYEKKGYRAFALYNDAGGRVMMAAPVEKLLNPRPVQG